MTDLAVFVSKEKGATLQKHPALPNYPPKPSSGEVLIKNVAVCSNPKDWKIAFWFVGTRLEPLEVFRVNDTRLVLTTRFPRDSGAYGKESRGTMSPDTWKASVKMSRSSKSGTRCVDGRDSCPLKVSLFRPSRLLHSLL